MIGPQITQDEIYDVVKEVGEGSIDDIADALIGKQRFTREYYVSTAHCYVAVTLVVLHRERRIRICRIERRKQNNRWKARKIWAVSEGGK